MFPIKKVKNLIEKHEDLEKELSSGQMDKKFFAEKSKEYSELNEIIEAAKEYLNYENNYKDLEKILEAQNIELELKDLASNELINLKKNMNLMRNI